jgi:hypothetical protein
MSSVDNQKCLFCEVIKIYNGLHHCVPLIEIVKKHIWNVQFGVQMRELCHRENVWTTGTTGLRSPVLPSEKVWCRYELPLLPVQDWNYRWMAKGGAVWRENELPVLPVLDRYFWWSLTGTTGRVCFESNSQISNWFVIDRFLDMRNLKNKP